MRRLILLLCVGLLAVAADDDPWTKVAKLKGGTELRVFKTGSVQPVLAQFGEVNDDKLVVIVGNEQRAISKHEIYRIDYRPDQPRLVKETSTTPSTVYDPNTNKTTSGVVVRGKADFQTIYRRPPPPAKK